MRVLILGGTLFIGRRIALELLARGDDVMVVHRGQTEPAELSGCAHVHVPRTALAEVAGRALRQARRGTAVPVARGHRAAAVADLRGARWAAPGGVRAAEGSGRAAADTVRRR